MPERLHRTAIEALQEREQGKRQKEALQKGYSHCLICKARIRTKSDYCFDCDLMLRALPTEYTPTTLEPVEGKDFIIQTMYEVTVTASGTTVWAKDEAEATRLGEKCDFHLDYEVEATKETRRLTLDGKPFDLKAWRSTANFGRKCRRLEEFGGA